MLKSHTARRFVLGVVGAAALVVILSSYANAARSCKPGRPAFLAGRWAGTGTAGGPTNKLSSMFPATAAGTPEAPAVGNELVVLTLDQDLALSDMDTYMRAAEYVLFRTRNCGLRTWRPNGG